MSGWKAVSVEEEAVGRELSSPEKVAVVGKAAGEEADERSVAYVAEVIEYEVEEDDMGHTGMERQHWSTGGCKVAEGNRVTGHQNPRSVNLLLDIDGENRRVSKVLGFPPTRAKQIHDSGTKVLELLKQ
jgi:hypothetical protein